MFVSNHQCPHDGGKTKFAWEITMTLVELMWARADAQYVAFAAAEHDSPAMYTEGGKLRGIVEMIAIFMTPHFANGDEVAREVIKRAKAKVAGETYETPGLGSRIYEMPRYEPSAAHKETQTKRNSIQELNARGVPVGHQEPKRKPVVGVRITADAETQAAIRGLGDVAEPDEIAQIYGLPVEMVKAILVKS
jgi:hypothetical protein